jgi:hypothetical protein
MESDPNVIIDSAIDSPEVIIINDLPLSPDAVVAAVAGILDSHAPAATSGASAPLQMSDETTDETPSKIDPPKIEISTGSDARGAAAPLAEEVKPVVANSWNYRENEKVRVKDDADADSDSKQKPKGKKHHRRHQTSSSSSSSSSSDTSGEDSRRKKKKKRRNEAQSQTALETQVAMLTSIVTSGKILLF